ncbi:MAG: DUF805 domain-containing protein [Alphaproteobacteria bacterium]|nr:DUF805 domain-containing protein [Alphaproteobacteria bacterium]
MATKKASEETSKVLEKKKPTKKAVLAKEVKAKEDTTKKVSKTKTVKSKSKPQEDKATDVLNKDNYNPIDEVLHVKALNEEKKEIASSKKLAKAERSTSSKKSTEASEEKGKRFDFTNKIHKEIKEKAIKVEAQKFKALKDEKNDNTSSWKAFIKGYKNMFSYKARTNRFEFWSFLAINFIFTALFVGLLVLIANQLNDILIGSIFIALVLVEILAFIALIARRLHDTGRKAWKGFFGPISYSAILNILTMVLFAYLAKDSKGMSQELFSKLLFVGSLAAIFAMINTYYSIKTFIVAGFVEEEKVENDFGVPSILTQKLLNKTIHIASIYFLLVFIASIINNIFMTLLSMVRGF